MLLSQVAQALERYAPLPLQESYDNAGLQIGLTETVEVSGALLCVDVSEDVIDEAVAAGCNLVVAHHPLLFRPLRRIDQNNAVARIAVKAIKAGVAVYAAHTNLDNAPDGVCHEMARVLGLENVGFLDPMAGGEGGSGVMGSLPEPMAPLDFLKWTKARFATPCIMHNALPEREIARVAVCGGAGDFLTDKAVAAGADAFITGEMGYHRFMGYEGEILTAAIGHYQSERCTVDLFARLLAAALPGLRLVKSVKGQNPVHYLTD